MTVENQEQITILKKYARVKVHKFYLQVISSITESKDIPSQAKAVLIDKLTRNYYSQFDITEIDPDTDLELNDGFFWNLWIDSLKISDERKENLKNIQMSHKWMNIIGSDIM